MVAFTGGLFYDPGRVRGLTWLVVDNYGGRRVTDQYLWFCDGVPKGQIRTLAVSEK